MFKVLTLTLSMVLALPFANSSALAAEDGTNAAIVVTVDRAKVFRMSRPASTVIIGNPSIADAAVEDDVTLVLTGRAFGVTNLIVLDLDGNPIVDETIVVKGHEENTVRIYRRSSRETMACAPVCQSTLTIGDDQLSFSSSVTQITTRNKLSEAGGK